MSSHYYVPGYQLEQQNDVSWPRRRWYARVDLDPRIFRAYTRNGIGRKVHRAVRAGTVCAR